MYNIYINFLNFIMLAIIFGHELENMFPSEIYQILHKPDRFLVEMIFCHMAHLGPLALPMFVGDTMVYASVPRVMFSRGHTLPPI